VTPLRERAPTVRGLLVSAVVTLVPAAVSLPSETRTATMTPVPGPRRPAVCPGCWTRTVAPVPAAVMVSTGGSAGGSGRPRRKETRRDTDAGSLSGWPGPVTSRRDESP
jgi:hypothetical protein